MEWKFQDNCKIKKLKRPTVRELTTALFQLRTKQLGFSINELFDLELGEVLDIMTESANDHAEYEYKATSADIDNVFG